MWEWLEEKVIGCKTIKEHFCSLIQSGFVNVFIPTDEIIGGIELNTEIIGELENIVEMRGSLEINKELIGEIEDDEILGIIEDNNEIKGKNECQ